MSCPVRSTRLAAFVALLALAGPIPAMRARAEDAPASATFHVSERGKDSWSGTLPAPNAAGTDGPFATPARARDAARRLRAADKAPRRGDIVILVHAGRYELAEPLVFAPEDSGTAESRTVFAAAPGDEGRAVLSGGRLVSGWKAEPGAARGVGRRPPRAEGRMAVPPRLGRRPVARTAPGSPRARPPPTPWPGSPGPTRTPPTTRLPTASNTRPARSIRAGRTSATSRSSSPTSGSTPTSRSPRSIPIGGS